MENMRYMNVRRDTENARYPSLCIPRAATTVTYTQVMNVISSLSWGAIDAIEIVDSKNPEQNPQSDSKRVFVHFHRWNIDNSAVAEIREKLMNGSAVPVVYDVFWFWKITASRYFPKPKKLGASYPARMQA
jgi:hypothetical protein